MAGSRLVLRTGRLAQETDVCAAAHCVGDDERVSPQRPGGGVGASQRGPHRWGYFDLMYNTRVPFGNRSPSCYKITVEFPVMP